MNIETIVSKDLRVAVEDTYGRGAFTSAILDALYFLSDLIRERTGLESDGVALVNQAFGGKTPLLKVTKLETESERNIQAGMEQILRGLYQGIRNPRSHGKYADSAEDADAIITFVDFLVRVIGQSRPRFDQAEFLATRVFDCHFAENIRYAQLLIDEIPQKQRLDVIVEVFRNKENGDCRKLHYFLDAMMKVLSPDEMLSLDRIISDELKQVTSETTIRGILQMLPSDSWMRYSEAGRIRIENFVISNLRGGRYDSVKNRCASGSLATWAYDFMRHFTLKEELISSLLDHLSGERDRQDYVFNFFFACLPLLQRSPSFRLRQIIKSGLKSGDRRFYDALTNVNCSSVVDNPWVSAFKDAYENFEDISFADQGITDDDVPF